jgi:predicted nucleic acid-binding protein
VRVFFDTNVLFSAFGFHGLCLEILRECGLHHTVVISSYVIEELERNLASKLGTTPDELADIREQLMDHCEILDKYPTLDVDIRDMTDLRFFLPQLPLNHLY